MLKRMKYFFVAMVVMIGLVVPQTTFAAAPAVKVFLDGQEIVYDVPPQIIAGRTMVPLALTVQALTGSPAEWDGDTRTVTFTAGGHTNVHQIGQTVVYADGAPVQFDTPSQIIGSRTLVPIRMIAETSGCKVDWDADKRHVIITSPVVEPPADDASSPQILAHSTPLGTEIAKGSDFKVNVTTNGKALSVWVEGKGGDAWQGVLVDAGNEDGMPKWEVTCYPLSDGQMKIYAAANEADTIVATETVEITFKEAKSPDTSSDNDAKPQLLGFTTTSGTMMLKGTEFRANLTTNGAAFSVWAEGPNGEKWQGALVDAGNEDGMPKWEIVSTPAGSGQVKIYAKTSDTSAGVELKVIDIMITE